MGFRLLVEGQETIELGMDNIQTVVYDTDTPNDSNACSTDVGSTLLIKGKIITATDGDSADDTMKLALWSLVPAEKADCYRKLTLEVIAADQVVRKIHFLMHSLSIIPRASAIPKASVHSPCSSSRRRIRPSLRRSTAGTLFNPLRVLRQVCNTKDMKRHSCLFISLSHPGIEPKGRGQ